MHSAITILLCKCLSGKSINFPETCANEPPNDVNNILAVAKDCYELDIYIFNNWLTYSLGNKRSRMLVMNETIEPVAGRATVNPQFAPADLALSILALDLVRGLAALEVMLSHLRGGNWVEFGALPPSQQTIAVKIFFFGTRLGHEAVMIFFVLSGFLVGGNLVSRIRQGRFKISDYAIDRGTRISIPLVAACVLTLVINDIAFGAPMASRPWECLGIEWRARGHAAKQCAALVACL